MIHLEDYCDRGEAWRLWENMDFVDRNVEDLSVYEGTDLQWMNFLGKWGNIEELVSVIFE